MAKDKEETTDEALARVAKEEAEAKEAEREAQAQRDAEDARGDIAEAETALEEAKDDLAEAEGKDTKHGAYAKGEIKDLKEDQIEHGKAPIAPGPEQPVDPEDAAAAKENRGRGLGG